MVAVLLWTLVPLVVLHGSMWRRSRELLRFQLALDIVIAVVVGPALLVGGDLNPVRCLERNQPFTENEWSQVTDFQPTQSDLVLQFHPWWAATREQVLQGRLPLIADDIGGGLPLLANGQTGLWAPVMLPVWVLGPERGTTVMALWKIELAGLGAFFFLWRVWRLRWTAATVGGLAYAGGTYQMAWLLVPLSWVTAVVPWMWWLTVSVLRRRAGWRGAVGLGVACGWLLGCGLHPETAAIAIGSAFLCGLVLHWRRWLRVGAAAVIMVVVSLVLAWPTVGYIGASSRLEVARDQRPNLKPIPDGWRGLASRQMLLPMVNGHPGRGDWTAPFPYAPAATGVGGLTLALLAAGSVRRRYRSLLWAALACLGVAAVLYLRLPPFDWLLVRVPPFDRMTLPRFAALVPWVVAVCAALSMDGALNGRLRGVGRRWSPVVLLAGTAVLFKPWQLAPVDFLLVIVTVASAAAAAMLIRRPTVVAWLVAVELACYAVGINPVAAAGDRMPRPEVLERLAALQAAEGGRIMGIDGMLPANLASRYGLADLRAYDPLRPRPFAAMFAELGQTDTVLGGPVHLAPPRLVGAWSVRFLVSGPHRAVDDWDEVWRGRDGVVWRNREWLPEVRVVGRTVTGGPDLLVSGTIDFSTTAVVPGGTPTVGASVVNFRVDLLQGSRIDGTADCNGPCLVLVARPWAPGWSAAVDGRRQPVVRANLAGLGVVVPPGRHRVEFDYRPWRWGDGVP